MGYTNSPLVSYTRLSPNHSGQRTHGIDRITPHCIVGQASVEGLCEWFAQSSTQASCNYGIGADGRVCLCVEEKNRSWCSSSNANDQHAITIECASDKTEPYAFKDVVYQKLIELCVDICKRNGKKKLIWFGDKDKTLNYEPKSDEMILTVHRWFANKSCPGSWMYARMGDLASKVTAQLGGESPTTEKNTSFPAVPFLVTVIIDDLNYRSEGSMNGKVLGQTGKGVFTIVEVKNGWGRLKSGAGWIYLENPSYCAIGKTVSSGKESPRQEEAKEEKSEEKVIWDTLYAAISNPYGTAGLMGNLFAESELKANNLQNNGNTKLGMTDAEFTAAFDKGSYPVDTFIHDGYGYGLAQWTYYTRKEALVNFMKAAGKSIGDLQAQLAFLIQEIRGYKAVWEALISAASVRDASDVVLKKYEAPADQSEAVQLKRAGYGQVYFDKYAGKSEKQETLPEKYEKYINSTGTHYISNSGSDERGQYTGGQAGDQTGKEWCMRSWYSRPWKCVLRHPDQKVALKLATLAIDAALNDKIGYDQSQNRTYLAQLKAVGWDPAKITVACEADCSAGVCANVTAAGYLLGIDALKNHTGTYTGNMRSALVKAGFQLLTDSKYLNGGEYLLPGDILLNDGAHTATNVTVGGKVKGSWNPGVTPAPAPSPSTQYYRVRRSWDDKASQIGAFTVLQNAINCVDANPGYAAFDDSGNQVYPTKNEGTTATKEQTTFPKYALTDTQLKKIARLCQQEQGSVDGAKAEASLMANQLETSASRRKKYGTGADGLYNWVRNGGWFSRAAHWMDNGSVSEKVLAGVKDVLVNGNRTLPLYVDEHDCLSDIQSISTGSVKNRSAYVQGKTVIKNRYGSTYTFWCFPDKTSDPFGYTDAAYKAVNGGEGKKEEKSTEFPYLVRVSISDLNYRKGPSTSYESWGYIEPGVYTIVEEQDGWGLLKAYADVRNGWVKLSYTERV